MPQITAGQTVQAQDFYDTFFSRFVTYANSWITYGTNNYHFPDIPNPAFTSAYGGSTSGLPLAPTSTNSINPGNIIDDQGIKDYIIGRSVEYCRIRSVSVTRVVTASGGPAQTSETRTGISHMTPAYAAPGFSNPGSTGNIIEGATINAYRLVQFIDDCHSQYNNNQRQNVFLASYSVCHNSCHSNCHGSRGRR